MEVSHLYEIEIDSSTDPVLYQTVELLKQAITDWPIEINTVEDFLHSVKKYLHCSEVTAEVIEKALSQAPSIRVLWQMEALSYVQELLTINKNDTLDSIIKRLL